ncbi:MULTISPECIES: hypothetical protein [Caldimonas]|uniref:hypothetical protein n=1 Tax=Caldimonas TaxID=196013 RepID=UPI00036D9F18|nr:hypothetical protein [Caldimonas manganoxidans]
MLATASTAPPGMPHERLSRHITATYMSLRLGLALLSVALPPALALAGAWLGGLPLQPSMSAYYHAGGGVVRDLFVGTLCAVAAGLHLYKGITRLENQALNLAAVLLVGVALVPMAWECGAACPKVSLHGTFAALFFMAIAYVCLFRAADTLSLLPDPALARRYRRTYHALGLAMILAPAAAFALGWWLERSTGHRWTLFLAEAAGVWSFAAYWLVKTFEMRRTHADSRAAEGQLAVPEHGVGDAFKALAVQELKR